MPAVSVITIKIHKEACGFEYLVFLTILRGWYLLDKRLLAFVVLSIIIGMGIVVFLAINPIITHAYYSKSIPDSDSAFRAVAFRFEEMEDTNLTISYVDDPTLWYSMNITLYEASMASAAFSFEDKTGIDVVDYTSTLQAFTRIKSVNVVFGSGWFYKIYISGTNLNVSIRYDNNAKLGNRDEFLFGIFSVECTGNVYFTFTKNVNYALGDMGALIGGPNNIPENVYLDVDLPVGLDGGLDIYNYTLYDILVNEGWQFQEFDSDSDYYSTTSETEHGPDDRFLYISVEAVNLIAQLRASTA